MSEKLHIKSTQGVELIQKSEGIATVRVINAALKRDLSWDRYVRLEASAKAVLQTKAKSILDAGGFDGALGFFLPALDIDLIDPATTGGSVLEIPVPDGSYDAVVAIDVLEHIEPGDRAAALSEFCRVARSHVILNYPCRESKEAQELMLKLTNHPLIREHVQWELPDSEWVLEELARYGFTGCIVPHASVAVWLGQYLSLNLMPEASADLNRHLVENYSREPGSKPLYHLVSCER